jgi:hypothetical protein
MTITTDTPTAAPGSAPAAAVPYDHRGSWLPTGRMIAARFNELRRRRGVMAMLAVVTIGIPTVYLAIRLILHAVAPKTYGAAGGYATYVGLVAFVLYIFGFIVAATLGATAGSTDLSEGMFRHHVITGRSRIALYLARIPAGLAIIWGMVLVGFALVCAVCVLAAPTTLNYDGVNVPAGLSLPALEQFASANANEVVNNFNGDFSPQTGPPVDNGVCFPNGPGPVGSTGGGQSSCTPAEMRAQAVQLAQLDYSDYIKNFRSPPFSLIVKSGLWLELEATIGFLVGLGLSSLIGQRTVSTVLLILLEVIITPLAFRAQIPHMINVQRAFVGLATAHLEPGNLPTPFGGGGGGGGGGGPGNFFVHESTPVAIIVIVSWVVMWTALGAWRMRTRDA